MPAHRAKLLRKNGVSRAIGQSSVHALARRHWS
jgi:hypothetical protein